MTERAIKKKLAKRYRIRTNFLMIAKQGFAVAFATERAFIFWPILIFRTVHKFQQFLKIRLLKLKNATVLSKRPRFTCFRDTPTTFLTKIIKLSQKNGKKQTGLKQFFFIWRLLLKQYKFNLAPYLETYVTNEFQIPFKLGQRHFSNRVYYFPEPLETFKQSRFFFRRFARTLNKKNLLREAVGFFQKLKTILIDLTQESPKIFIYRDIQDHIEFGYKNRMFVHYRWQKKNYRRQKMVVQNPKPINL